MSHAVRGVSTVAAVTSREFSRHLSSCSNADFSFPRSQLLIHMVAHTENQVNLFGGTHIVERWQQVAAQARHEEKCLKENKPLQFVDSTRDFWSSLAFQITPEENALVQAAFPGLEFHTATRGTLGPSSEAETLKMKKVRTTDPSPFPIKRKGVTPFSGTPGKKVRVDTKPHSTLKPSGQPVQPTENVVLDNEGPSGDLGSTSGFDNTRASEAVTDLDWFLQNGPSDPALAEAEKGFSQLKADLTGLQQSKRLAKGPLLEAGVRVLPSTEKKKSEDESTSPESSPFVPGTLGAWFMEGARLFSSLEDRVDGFDDRLTALEQRIHHLERSRSRRQ